MRHSSRASSLSRSSHLLHVSGIDVIAFNFLSGTLACLRPVVTVGTSSSDTYGSNPDMPNSFTCGCGDCFRSARVALDVVFVVVFALAVLMVLLLLFACSFSRDIQLRYAAVWIDTFSMRRALRELSPDVLPRVFLRARQNWGETYTPCHTRYTSRFRLAQTTPR